MPTYVYTCNSCNDHFERYTLIVDRHKATKEKCPGCGAKKSVELVPVAPGIGDPISLGVTRLPDHWIDRLKSIKRHHSGSTIKVDKTMSK